MTYKKKDFMISNHVTTITAHYKNADIIKIILFINKLHKNFNLVYTK